MFKVLNGSVVDFRLGCFSRANVGSSRLKDEKR